MTVPVQKLVPIKVTSHAGVLTAEGFEGCGIFTVILGKSWANQEEFSQDFGESGCRASALGSGEESSGCSSALQDFPYIEEPSIWIYLQPKITKRQIMKGGAVTGW